MEGLIKETSGGTGVKTHGCAVFSAYGRRTKSEQEINSISKPKTQTEGGQRRDVPLWAPAALWPRVAMATRWPLMAARTLDWGERSRFKTTVSYRERERESVQAISVSQIIVTSSLIICPSTSRNNEVCINYQETICCCQTSWLPLLLQSPLQTPWSLKQTVSVQSGEAPASCWGRTVQALHGVLWC